MKRNLFAVLLAAVCASAVPTSAWARASFFVGLNFTYVPHPMYQQYGWYYGRPVSGVLYCPANTVDAFFDYYGRPVCLVSPPPRVVPRYAAKWAAKTPVPAENSYCKGKKADDVFVCPESPTGKCICQ